MVAGKPCEISSNRLCFLPVIGNPIKLINQFEEYSIGNANVLMGRSFEDIECRIRYIAGEKDEVHFEIIYFFHKMKIN